MFYRIADTLSPCSAAELERGAQWVAVLTRAQVPDAALPGGVPALDPAVIQSPHFCKSETYPGELRGTISIPARGKRQERAGFCFVIRADSVLFVDDGEVVEAYLHKIQESRRWKAPSAGRFFYDFLDVLIDGELVYLEELENRLAKLENAALSDTLNNFNHRMQALRKEIMALTHYYIQLEDMGAELEENENDFFSPEEERLFHLFRDRSNRLREETQLLREYSLQIREIYQAQIDIGQNRIMKILTVVTAIFLPLTLIAGWYGMNFTHMPELSWTYGYPAVILLSIAVVILAVWWIKKKKFW